MILSKPSIVSMDTIDREATLRKIEAAAKNCYQSKTKEDINDVAKFVAGLVKSGHMSPVELGGMFNVTIKTSRAVMAEITRHRAGVSFCISSQRFVDEAKSQFGVEYCIPNYISAREPDLTEGYYEVGMIPIQALDGQMVMNMAVATATISPDGNLGITRSVKCSEATGVWLLTLAQAEQTYIGLHKQFGWRPEEARGVLPNDTMTTITMGANLREWRHIFDLRLFGITGKPFPPCQEVMALVYKEFHEKLPEIFPEDYTSTEVEQPKKEPPKKSSILLGV